MDSCAKKNQRHCRNWITAYTVLESKLEEMCAVINKMLLVLSHTFLTFLHYFTVGFIQMPVVMASKFNAVYQ